MQFAVHVDLSGMSGLWLVVSRRRPLLQEGEGGLSRCLGPRSLTCLGVGSTLGVGVYVLAGHVARDTAGPAVTLSFLLAAIVSMFAGLCYAEFGGRVPRAGSAYTYSYVCVGELIAFIIGWNLILEYAIGSASVCRGISLYLDTLLNNTLKETFLDIAPVSPSFMSPYFDLFAFGLAFLLSVFLAFGMKKSSRVNNVFTLLNICVVIFVIVVGSLKADISNWKIPSSAIPEGLPAGSGGFFPFGVSGVLRGAATCFYGFVGFDCIAAAGEEARNPRRDVPLAILASLLIAFLAYSGVSIVLTLMWPYFLQDVDAPVPHVFEEVGWLWAKWVVAIGGIFGMLASLFGAMFPLPRILYAMASDGLIFRSLGTISQRFNTPLIGTLLAGVLTGTMAGLFELKHLVNMMSIGTLMAYTVVAASVLTLRYEEKSLPLDKKVVSIENFESTLLMHGADRVSLSLVCRQLFTCHRQGSPSRLSSTATNYLIVTFCLLSLAFALLMSLLWVEVAAGEVWGVVLVSVVGLLLLTCVLLISCQPKADTLNTFQVPLVPLIPCISILCNIYLMVMLDVATWIRFGVWMAVGLPIYLLSMYLYSRGPNYVIVEQKSSINNGHMNGNLNYAFENMAECRERGASLAGSDKIKEAGTSQENQPSAGLNLNGEINPEIQDDQIKVTNFGTENEVEDAVKIIQDELVGKENKDGEAEMLTSFSDLDRLREMKIMEFLDQVLQNEEENASLGDVSTPEVELQDYNLITYRSVSPSVSSIMSGSVVVDVDVNAEEQDPGSVLSAEVNKTIIAVVHVADDKKSNDDDVTQAINEIENKTEQVDVTKWDSANVEHKVESENEKVTAEEKAKEVVNQVENVVIPAAPPMDEAFFTSSVRFKKWNPPKKKEKKAIDKEMLMSALSKEPNIVDNGVQMKFGTERQASFMNKLNTLLKHQSGNEGKIKRSTSTTNLDEIQTDEDFSSLKEKHKSEPSIVAALKRDIQKLRIPDNSEGIQIDGEDASTSANDKPVDVSREEPTPDDNAVDVTPLNRKDLKLKLESLFAVTPAMIRPPTRNDPNRGSKLDSLDSTASFTSDGESVVDEEVLKEIPVEKYTNTMKLQRARFGDVLKSLNKRDSINSSSSDLDRDEEQPKLAAALSKDNEIY